MRLGCCKGLALPGQKGSDGILVKIGFRGKVRPSDRTCLIERPFERVGSVGASAGVESRDKGSGNRGGQEICVYFFFVFLIFPFVGVVHQSVSKLGAMERYRQLSALQY